MEVWAEKYRPMKLTEVINQRHVVERVKAFVKEKAIPHLLFAGSAGTGKTTVALCIARELYGDAWRQNILELNASVTPDTPIMIREKSKIERTNFGKLAEKYFKDTSSNYVYPNDIEILSINKDLEVVFQPIKNISRHMVKKIAKIEFEGGSIKTTLDHSVMIIKENGEIVPVRTEELNEGDLLITFKTKLLGNEMLIDLEKYAPEEFHAVNIKGRIRTFRNPKVKTIVEKFRLIPEIAWMMGSYLAEGSTNLKKNNTSGSLIFTYGYPSEVNVANQTSQIFKDFFDITSRQNLTYSGFDRSKASATQLRIFSTQFARFFRDIFYDKSFRRFTAKNKRVPSFIFNSPLEAREAFLRGYSGDASGKWGKYLRYSSHSKENLLDIAWLGRISGLDTSFFETETKIIWKLPTFSYIRSELIPSFVLINFFERIKDRVKFNWRYLLRHQLYSKKSKRVSKNIAEKLLKRIDKSKLTSEEKQTFEKIMKLINSSISFLKIKKIRIEDYNGYVYDISVSDVEAFWGGTIPILLHNSDARGIDVIRGQVKNFARTKALGEVPYKIIILDEADNTTSDAQQALRRTMETFTSVSRMILIANYSSRIIDPIQSRCAVFRFNTLPESDVRKFIDRIVKGEELKITEGGIKAIIDISEGDLRRVANLLQASASLGKKITEEVVYDVASRARPDDIKRMLELAIKGKFQDARKMLQDMLLRQGLSGDDIIYEIHRQIYNLPVLESVKVELVEKCGEYQFRISQGGNELIQLTALLSQFLRYAKS
ncbi:MAG: replication factor C small subunit [Candidatus Aenigmarchaeota archaeon]|nr:replication factor C small subunit [Candidatus Aenigmarchaeota archaeon]